jgi:hypothetical protein
MGRGSAGKLQSFSIGRVWAKLGEISVSWSERNGLNWGKVVMVISLGFWLVGLVWCGFRLVVMSQLLPLGFYGIDDLEDGLQCFLLDGP